MSKSNPTNAERMAVIETKINNLETKNKEQYKLLEKIDTKLDNVIENKAEKSEVEAVNEKVNKITWKIMAGFIFMLLTVIGYLLKQALFN